MRRRPHLASNIVEGVESFEKLQRKLSSSKRLVRSPVHWSGAGFVTRPPICARLFLIARRPELASSKPIRLTLICFAWECSFASLSVEDVPKSRIRPAWHGRNGLRLRVVETMLVVADDAARHREIFLAAVKA